MRRAGVRTLPHPAYSQDLAPSDYHLFCSVAHFLKERRFENIDDLKNKCHQFFESKDKSWYRIGIEQLAERWVNVGLSQDQISEKQVQNVLILILTTF